MSNSENVEMEQVTCNKKLNPAAPEFCASSPRVQRQAHSPQSKGRHSRARWHGDKLENSSVVSDATSFERRTKALWTATAEGDANAIEKLLLSTKSVEESIVFVNERDPKRNFSLPIHLAAEKGHVRLMQLLVEHGANINARDALLNTPLHLAAKYNHVLAVRWLLDHGAHADVRNKDGMTALELVADREGRGRPCARLFENPHPERRRFAREEILAFKPKSASPQPLLFTVTPGR